MRRRLPVRAGERDLPGAERTDRRSRAPPRACSRVSPPSSVLPTRTPGRTRPSYCWLHAYRAPAPTPTASSKPRTNATPKRRASDRRRRGRAGGGPSVTAAARGSGPATAIERRARRSATCPPGPRRSARPAQAPLRVAASVRGDERRELRIAGGRVAVGCGGVGSPVGCGVGQVGHQMLMRGRPEPRPRPWQRRHLTWARKSVTRHSPRCTSRTGSLDAARRRRRQRSYGTLDQAALVTRACRWAQCRRTRMRRLSKAGRAIRTHWTSIRDRNRSLSGGRIWQTMSPEAGRRPVTEVVMTRITSIPAFGPR